jgi:hypothetical protein
MKTSGITQWVFIGALPAVICLFWVTALLHFHYTPDDTYIYLQFAKNILHGQGISFNAGEPTYGFTSPLWLFFVTLGGKFGGDLLFSAKTIDLAFAGISLIIFFLLAFEIIRDQAIALLCTIACSLNIWFLRWAGTGMETSLAVCLVLSSMLLTLRNRYIWAGIVASIGALARPEIYFLVPLIVMDIVINTSERRHAILLSLRLVGISLLVVGPWLLFAYRTFGTIVPNTALAKGGFHFTLDEVSSTAIDFLKTILVSDGLAVIVLIAACIVLLYQSKRAVDDQKFSSVQKFILFRQSLVGIGWVVTLPVLYIIAGVDIVSRYLLLMTPLVTIYAFWYLERSRMFSRSARFRYSVILVVTALIMLQSQVIYRRYVLPGIVEFEQGMDTALIPIGRWLNEHTPADAIVFVPDVGAVGFYSDRKICDAAGLISPDMLSFIRQGYTEEMMIENNLFRSSCNAGYLVDRSFVPERWKSRSDLVPQITKTFSRMGIADPRTNYYTIYKVLQSPR